MAAAWAASKRTLTGSFATSEQGPGTDSLEQTVGRFLSEYESCPCAQEDGSGFAGRSGPNHLSVGTETDVVRDGHVVIGFKTSFVSKTCPIAAKPVFRWELNI